jgi:hypothetical protein
VSERYGSMTGTPRQREAYGVGEICGRPMPSRALEFAYARG